MKIKLRIRQKIQVLVISASFLVYLLSFGYITYNIRKSAYKEAVKSTDNYVLNSATKIQDKFSNNMTIVTTLSNAFKTFDDFEKEEWQSLINKMYKGVFESNPQVYGMWDSWELRFIDSAYTKNYGRLVNSYWRDNNTVKNEVFYRSMDGDSELYKEIKKLTVPSIKEPYFDVAQGSKTESVLMTSLNSPVLKDGKYAAVISMDISLESIQKMLEEIKPYDDSYAYMVTNKGFLAGHPNKNFINKSIEDIGENYDENHDIVNRVKKGQAFNYTRTDQSGNKVFVSYAPVRIKGTNTPWAVAVAVPERSMLVDAARSLKISILVGIIGLLLISLMVYYIGGYISRPIVKITQLLKLLSEGNISNDMKIELRTGDELQEMTESANMLIDGLGKTAEFARQIGKGNLSVDYSKLGENDMLGEAITDMRNSLVKAEEDNNERKIEEERQNWITQGLAKFGDILRSESQDISKLSFNIMSNLVDYVGAIQGALFVTGDAEGEIDAEDMEYELASAIAYNRQKVMESKFKVGEGLVGRCAYERLTIYMEEVPEDYVYVTSGLGESNPRSILLIPAILNDEVFGVIELVSFSKFDAYQIDFVEKIGESLASVISTAKVGERTQRLLAQSKQQSEELAAQEEEMRQNLEELQATQEEIGRLREEDKIKNEKLVQEMDDYKKTLLKIIDHVPAKIFLKDSKGKMEIANKKLLDVHNTTLEEIRGKTDFDFFPGDYQKAKSLWDSEQALIKSGEVKKECYEEVIGQSKGVILDSTLYPIYIDYLKETGILGIQIDVTELKRREKEIESLKERLGK